jgi:peroxiredoxin/mono/diheme cytochrome c family protein
VSVFIGLLVVAMLPLRVPDFELPDPTGTITRLSTVAGGRPTVVVFLGADCPLAALYVPRLNELVGRFAPGTITLLAIAPNRGDDPPVLTAFVREHRLTFPLLRDADGRIAARFGATRSPEAFVLDANRCIRYRGRIDDQYTAGGKNRGAPTREDLVEAVRAVLAGRPVAVPVTECSGCVLSKPRRAAELPGITYSKHIAPILATHCQVCHRPGEVGPFTLLSYADAVAHAGTIAEVVESGLMPPWHAAPAPGRFRNERRLSAEQKRLIAEWIRAGCPEGDPLPPSIPAAAGWRLGTPDAVYAIPVEFRVPAEGIIEYQNFIVDPGLTTDAWVRAVEVRPGNRRVVHHCSVFLQPPGATGTDTFFETGALGSENLIAFTPGSEPLRFPDGMAKRIPAGWRLHFIVHYQAVGTPQTDRTELAVQFLAPEAVRKEVATKLLMDIDLVIPPNAPAHRVERAWTAERDCLLLSVLPHMHLRGKSFRYTVEYPDGTSEVLLDVPAYDFNWQHRYELTEPMRLPAGTVLRCTAVYDNSVANPFNPDPGATVRAGLQSTDEMFNGYFDIVLADQDISAEFAAAAQRRRALWLLWSAVLLVCLWGGRMVLARRRGRGGVQVGAGARS